LAIGEQGLEVPPGAQQAIGQVQGSRTIRHDGLQRLQALAIGPLGIGGQRHGGFIGVQRGLEEHGDLVLQAPGRASALQQGRQGLGIRRWSACQGQRDVVVEQPALREVFPASGGIAPAQEASQPDLARTVELGGGTEREMRLRVVTLLPGEFEHPIHVGGGALGVAARRESRFQSLGHGVQVADVVGGVGELALRQGASEPVRTRLGFLERHAQHLLHQRLVAHAGPEAGEGGRDLRVEQATGQDPEGVAEGDEVLARAVHQGVRGAHDGGKGLADAVRERIHEDDAAPGVGDLHQCELRIPRPLPHELGIEGQGRAGFEGAGRFVQVGDALDGDVGHACPCRGGGHSLTSAARCPRPTGFPVPSLRAALFTALMIASFLLAACGRSEVAPADASPAPSSTPDDAVVEPAAEPVAAEPQARWAPAPLPAPATAKATAAFRESAAEAEAAGRWVGQDPPGALDLHLALLVADPTDVDALAGRERAVAALGAAFEDARRRGDAPAAGRTSAVLAVVDPDRAAARERARADLAAALALVETGRLRLEAGQWFAPKGRSAVAAFREAGTRVPGLQPAADGLAAVETALLSRAARASERGEFDDAEQDLRRADRLRLDPARVQDGRAALAKARSAAAESALADVDSALQRLDLQAAARALARAERTDPQSPGLDDAAQRLSLARRYGHFRPSQRFSDTIAGGEAGPAMVVMPHGGFTMGAVPGEDGARDNEGPPHPVGFERGFALAVRETTVADFARFVAATGYVTRAEREGRSMVYDERGGAMVELRGAQWRRGFDGRSAAGKDDPVLHVAFEDAIAYAEWLSARAGQRYRLPSEAEFEYALRAGGEASWPWGGADAPARAPGNLTGDGDRSPQGRRWGRAIRGWTDGAWGPAPVASYPAEGFGTHDLIGNVSEWVEDCWHDGYRRAPDDGRAWVNPGCSDRVVRGGSWASTLDQARSAFRLQVPADFTSARIGFRVARDL